jgi:tetratricopeptide (TPR) repeat protein
MIARKDRTDDYCFDKAVQLDSDWLVPLEIGGIYLHYSKPAKALPRLRQALEKASDQAYCWYRQGACELALGLNRQADASFRRCLELEPGHADARRELVAISSATALVGGFIRKMFGRK